MADPRERERELGYPRPGKKEGESALSGVPEDISSIMFSATEYPRTIFTTRCDYIRITGPEIMQTFQKLNVFVGHVPAGHAIEVVGGKGVRLGPAQ